MLYGVVMAGGKSSRMGEDKGNLVFQGQSFLDRAISVLRAAGAEKILLSGLNDSTSTQENVVAVPDQDINFAGGPPRGLYSVFDWLHENNDLNNQFLLLIPVDMPLLSDQVLRELVNKAEESEQVSAVAFSGEVFPLLIRAGVECHELLKRGLESERSRSVDVNNKARRFSMKAILAGLNAEFVSLDKVDSRVFTNINTPEDLRACFD